MRVDNVRLAAIAAAALMIIGGLGAWITLASSGEVLFNGGDRDGAVIIGCAVVYALGVLRSRRWSLILAALAALLAAVIAVNDIQDVESEPLLDAGWGLWLDAAASLIAFVLAAALRRRPRRR